MTVLGEVDTLSTQTDSIQVQRIVNRNTTNFSRRVKFDEILKHQKTEELMGYILMEGEGKYIFQCILC